MHKYEIEIKSLLGSKAKADELVAKMKKQDPNLKILGSHKQLNHYFVPTPAGTGQAGGDLQSLYNQTEDLLDEASKTKLADLARRAKTTSRTGAEATGAGNFSVRTREADGKIFLVVKAAVDDTTSSNGTARLEWENLINLPLVELDKLILDAGFAHQAKWSRERQGFSFTPSPHYSLSSPLNIAIDKNAGYGYLAEFEMLIDDQSKADETKIFIRALIENLGVEELPQDRLERMFKFYNDNWRDYYGTDKTFTIE